MPITLDDMLGAGRINWLFGAVLAGSLTFGPALAQEQAAATGPTIASVTVASAVEAQVIAQVPVSGTLVPRDEVLIYPQVNGYTIEELGVDVGDQVEAGDVLATLNADTLTAQLAQAQAEYARAEASVRQAQSQITSANASATRTASALNRAERLQEAGTTTQATLDQALADAQTAEAAVASAQDGLAVAQAQLQQAQAQLDIAELNLERATLRAPVDGLISARNGQIGAIAASGGEPIFRIISGGVVEMEADVIETALGQITVGDSAQLSVAGVGEMSGTVRRISPTVDPVSRLGTIRIETSDPSGLRSGVFASGLITVTDRVALTVPTTAILTDSAGTYALVVNDTILEKRPVTAGLIWQDRREVVAGLAAGEVVVAKAGAFYGDGDAINPIHPDIAIADGAAQ
ncbi:efflux RND transporter periplasmic adaptor subunit [Flavimaricola marinus]|uniref:Multidrug resistance protein MdtE n=1 Tax=Flavimaricola marinus TaxID=1819565 RepID=A0A238LIA6_9RHOB|nr:efflux RND transporter periplasmic adaptor subunit [Flavimaricola marinus]SMY09419.1 Multidrug resistance protein MdtE precursor [Flavimaricola marinus]